MASNEFDGGLDQMRRELRELATAATGPDGQPLEGHGEAANGLVRVSAVHARLSAMTLDPRAMRLASRDLAEAFVTAANAALADLAAKHPEASAPTIDLAALEAQLAEVQQQGLAQLRQYTQSITDALARLDR